MTIEEFEKESTFKIGTKNTAFSKYFIGQSYLYPYGGVNGVNVANVTFEPGCRNNWHSALWTAGRNSSGKHSI